MIVKVHQSGECIVPGHLINPGSGFRKISVPVLSLVAEHPQHGTVLVDTGYDPAFTEATRGFPAKFYRWVTRMTDGGHPSVCEWLRRTGENGADPSHIVISHVHADHIAGIHAFGNSQIWASEPALNLIREYPETSMASLAHGFIPELFPANMASRVRTIPFRALDWEYRDYLPVGHVLFNDGSITIVPLPGHSMGHCGVMLRSSNLGAIFYLADTVWDIRAITDDMHSSRLTMWLHDAIPYQRTIRTVQKLLHHFPDIYPLPCHCTQSADSLGLRLAEDGRR